MSVQFGHKEFQIAIEPSQKLLDVLAASRVGRVARHEGGTVIADRKDAVSLTQEAPG